METEKDATARLNAYTGYQSIERATLFKLFSLIHRHRHAHKSWSKFSTIGTSVKISKKKNLTLDGPDLRGKKIEASLNSV